MGGEICSALGHNLIKYIFNGCSELGLGYVRKKKKRFPPSQIVTNN